MSTDPETVPYTFDSIYQSDTWWPQSVIGLSDPFILRDVRGITVQFNLFRHNAVREKLLVCKRLLIRIFPDGIGTINVMENRKWKTSKDFLNLYKNVFLNFSENKMGSLGKMTSGPPLPAYTRMLIIAADDFYNNMIPFRDWRTRKGYKTTLVKCSDVGTTRTQVKNYIQNKYNTDGVTYILLVGDAENVPNKGVPPDSGDYVASLNKPADPMYTRLDGTDYYPDAYISRFSTETAEQVDNQVMRTIKYETNPVIGDWILKGCGIAGSYAKPLPIQDTTKCNRLRNDLLLSGLYTSVDKIYAPEGTTEQITSALNEGRGIVNYVGHGATYAAWSGPYFSTADVFSLQNTNLLPFILSNACRVGNFPGNTCLAEAWLRAGSKDRPTGAIATYMPTIDVWADPADSIQHKAVELFVEGDKKTVGEILFNAACDAITHFTGRQNGIDNFETFHIFGDASVNVWAGIPMIYDNVSVTDNGTSITVNTGINGSTICVSSGNNGSSFWERVDNVNSYMFNTSVRPLYITITKDNYIPYTAVTGGVFTSNETWFGNLNVIGNVQFSSSAKLDILHGATIKFNLHGRITVYGRLIARGTSSQQVTFTSSNASPAPGDWMGLWLHGGPDTLEYCNIRYAQWGIGALNTNTHFIKNSTIEQCANGIVCLNTGTSSRRTIIHFSTIRNNPVGIILNNSRIDIYKTRVENNTQCYGGIYAMN
ncbi:MAG: C25 family cysteine peptidase, partial [Bacteroidota bacterium]|nr:C25 family cysteine peptidase [Bacteroidota bacterium]